MTHRETVEDILVRTRRDHAVLLESLSPALRASLPVDAAGITQAIDHLGEVVDLSRQLRDEQFESHRANPAVLHGRVFGRAPLTRATVLAAFVEGARVREGILTRLAQAAGGADLESAVRDRLDRHPPRLDAGDDTAEAMLRAAYAAQEDAAILIASHLDEDGRWTFTRRSTSG